MSKSNLTQSDDSRKPIVQCDGDRIFASSRDVAEFFKKQHREVLRAIDDLIENLAAQNCTTLYFNELRCFNAAANRDTRHFEMSRDGFSLLVMGFTGAEALAWKLRYIEAFNAMEAQLRAAAPRSQYDWMRAVVDDMEKTNQRLFTVEKAVENLGAHEDYRSIKAHAALIGRKTTSNKESSDLGKQATALTRQMRHKIGSQPDEAFGHVNTYHRDVLEAIFKETKPT